MSNRQCQRIASPDHREGRFGFADAVGFAGGYCVLVTEPPASMRSPTMGPTLLLKVSLMIGWGDGTGRMEFPGYTSELFGPIAKMFRLK